MGVDNIATWPNRAYLMLVGSIYCRMATEGDLPPTEELIDLAKALAENRRAVARDAGEDWERAGLRPSVRSAGPGAFADAIREIYGLSSRMPDGISAMTDNPASDRTAISDPNPT